MVAFLPAPESPAPHRGSGRFYRLMVGSEVPGAIPAPRLGGSLALAAPSERPVRLLGGGDLLLGRAVAGELLLGLGERCADRLELGTVILRVLVAALRTLDVLPELGLRGVLLADGALRAALPLGRAEDHRRLIVDQPRPELGVLDLLSLLPEALVLLVVPLGAPHLAQGLAQVAVGASQGPAAEVAGRNLDAALERRDVSALVERRDDGALGLGLLLEPLDLPRSERLLAEIADLAVSALDRVLVREEPPRRELAAAVALDLALGSGLGLLELLGLSVVHHGQSVSLLVLRDREDDRRVRRVEAVVEICDIPRMLRELVHDAPGLVVAVVVALPVAGAVARVDLHDRASGAQAEVARIEAVGIARLGRELDDRGAPEPAGVLVADDVAGEGVAGLGRGLVEHGEALVPRLGEAGHVALGQAVLGEDLGTVGTM